MELREAFSRESFLQRQSGRLNLNRPIKVRHRTRTPGGNRLAGHHPMRLNNTNLRVNSYNLIPCVFDGPFLSICYNRRPVCKSDEILCRKETTFCCYKPLCDILPTTSTTPDPSGSTTEGTTTTLDPIDYCNPYGSYVLVSFSKNSWFRKTFYISWIPQVCTEPNKFPQCPTEDPDVDICKLAKPFSDEYVYCCHKPMDPNTTTTDVAPWTDTTTTEPNLNYECDFMG